MFLRKLFTTFALAAAVAVPTVVNADCGNVNFKAEMGNGRFSRVAEDLLLPTGNGGSYRLSTLGASIATNLSPGFEVWFEVFREAASGGPGARILSIRAQTVVTTSVPLYVTVGGVQHRKYSAFMTMPSNMALQLRPGESVWIGAYVRGPYAAGKSAFLLRGDSRAHSPANTRVQSSSTSPWLAPIAADCDMMISSTFKQFCPADFNKSGGSPNSTDVSLFISAYTARSASADMNGDRVINTTDLGLFLAAYNTPCTMQVPTF